MEDQQERDSGATDGAIVTVAGLGAQPGQDGVLVLAGRVDVLSVAVLRDVLATAVDAGLGDLVVDVAGLELVDATGLGVLLAAHRRARRSGRRLVLRNPGIELVRLLHRTRLSRVIATLENAGVGEIAVARDLSVPVPRLAAG